MEQSVREKVGETEELSQLHIRSSRILPCLGQSQRMQARFVAKSASLQICHVQSLRLVGRCINLVIAHVYQFHGYAQTDGSVTQQHRS